MMSVIEFDREVDASGLSCPLPILRAKKALATMERGETLKVISTDPGSVRDFQAFARQNGNDLIRQIEAEGGWVHVLKRR